MFNLEHSRAKLATRRQFRHRLAKATAVSVIIFITSLTIGVVGYHVLADLPWVDSFLNASMILGGMGPVNELHTSGGKLFASFYALFSGIIFLASVAILIAPVAHRFLHRLHLEGKEK